MDPKQALLDAWSAYRHKDYIGAWDVLADYWSWREGNRSQPIWAGTDGIQHVGDHSARALAELLGGAGMESDDEYEDATDAGIQAMQDGYHPEA